MATRTWPNSSERGAVEQVAGRTWANSGGAGAFENQEVGGGVDIVTPLKTFALTKFIPSIETGLNIAVPAPKAFSLTKFLPTIAAAEDTDIIVPAPKSFSLSKFAPAINLGVDVLIPVPKAFSLAGFDPSINLGVNIISPLGSFTLSKLIPGINLGVAIVTPLKTFTHTGFDPTIEAVPSTIIWEDDFESYADLAAMKADPPGYNEQTQHTGNVITVSTEQAHSGTQSVKFFGVANPASPPAGKCALIMDEDDFDPTFSFVEGDILSWREWIYIVNPGDNKWSETKPMAFEDKVTGDGMRLRVTASTGVIRIERDQFGFSNETPSGQSSYPVDTWVEFEFRFRMGIIPTDDETNFPNAGVDFYAFDADDAGWYQLIMDSVIVGEASCTTMITGDTYNMTFGQDAVSEDTIMYVDDIKLEKPTGPFTNDVTIVVPLGAFVLTKFSPTILTGVTIIVPTPKSFSLNSFVPTIGLGVVIITPLGSFTLTGFDLVIALGLNIVVPIGSFTRTNFLPSVASGVGIAVPLKTFTRTDFIPTIGTDTIIITPLGSFTLTGFIPAVELFFDIITPLKEFNLNSFNPVIHSNRPPFIDGTTLDLTPPFDDISQMRYLFRNFAVLRDLLETGVDGQFTTADGKTALVRRGVIVDIY